MCVYMYMHMHRLKCSMGLDTVPCVMKESTEKRFNLFCKGFGCKRFFFVFWEKQGMKMP